MTLAKVNEYLPLPTLLVLVGVLACMVAYPTSPWCFGDRTQEAAQRGAEQWLNHHLQDSVWRHRLPQHPHIQCLPLRHAHDQWTECRIFEEPGSWLIVDCDTATRNNIGCISGR